MAGKKMTRREVEKFVRTEKRAARAGVPFTGPLTKVDKRRVDTLLRKFNDPPIPNRRTTRVRRK